MGKQITKMVMVDVVVATREFNIPHVVGCVQGFGALAISEIGHTIERDVPKDWYRIEQAPRWMFDDRGYFIAQSWVHDKTGDLATRFVYDGPLERYNRVKHEWYDDDPSTWVVADNQDDYSFSQLIFPEE